MENSTTSKWVQFLRSEKWVAITFVFITVPLIIHTQHLMLRVTGFHFDLFPYDEELYALLFALGFDLAMITFAVNGKENEATGLAFIVFLFNSFFLNYDFLINISGVTEPGAQLAVKIFINVSIAGTASWIVHRYVSFFNELIGAKQHKFELYGKVEALKQELASEIAKVKGLEEENKRISAELKDSENKKLDEGFVDPIQHQAVQSQLATMRDAYAELMQQHSNLNESYEYLRSELAARKAPVAA
ncbi:MAG: hypothetical protein IM613_20810 [Cytophagales bacterium]|nr:hypothetical protein [Cytophagales bacterium]